MTATARLPFPYRPEREVVDACAEPRCKAGSTGPR